MNSPKYSLNLTPLVRNFGEKCTSPFAVGTRLSIRLTYPLWRKFKNVKREAKRKLASSFAVGTRLNIRLTYLLWRGICMTLCSWSSLKGFNKIFSLDSIIFLWRKI